MPWVMRCINTFAQRPAAYATFEVSSAATITCKIHGQLPILHTQTESVDDHVYLRRLGAFQTSS